jgi:hypothetical protein
MAANLTELQDKPPAFSRASEFLGGTAVDEGRKRGCSTDCSGRLAYCCGRLRLLVESESQAPRPAVVRRVRVTVNPARPKVFRLNFPSPAKSGHPSDGLNALALVVPQNLIRAHGNAGDSMGHANAVDFESGNRRRDGYTALFLSRPLRRLRDTSLRDRTERTAGGLLDCIERPVLARSYS